MTSPRIILILVGLLLASAASSFAQTPEDIRTLKSRLDQSSLTEFATEFRTDRSPKWPRITTQYGIRELKGPEREAALAALALGEAFLRKLDLTFDRTPPAKWEKVSEEIGAYADIGEKIRASGGYTNLAIADTIDHVIFYRLSAVILKTPDKIGNVKGWIGARSRKPFDAKALLTELADQDEALERQKDKIASLKGDENFAALSASFDVGGAKSKSEGKSDLTTSQLLKKPSALGLVTRIGITDAFLRAVLPGAIHFYESGGTSEDLDPKDNSHFKKKMGKSMYDYKAPFIGMKYLDASRVRAFVETQSSPEASRKFLDDALR